MTRLFIPIEHFGRHDAEVIIKDIDISASERIASIANAVRGYLRDEYGHTFSRSILDQGAREEMKQVIADYLRERRNLHINGVPLDSLIKTVQQEILYFGPIQKALDDPSVTNIDINSPSDVYIERNGEEERHPEYGFRDTEHLLTVINKMLMPLGKTLTASEPAIDSLFEGCRICAVLNTERGGIAIDSPVVSIRKFPDEVIQPQHLVKYGTLSQEMNEFFQDALVASNVIIAGSTNSGKTTTLVAIPLYFDPRTRIITIEDSPEMQLRHKSAYREYRNIVPFLTKHHEDPEKRFTIARLTKVSLRMRPWKIIIGEVRDGSAAKQMAEAMNTGHQCYSTIHASSARNAATRIVQLAGDGYNDEAIAAQLADCVDLIIFQQRVGKSRIITEVVELIGYEGAKRPICNTLFKYVQTGKTTDGYAIGYHQRVSPVSQDLADKMSTHQVAKEKIARWLIPPTQEPKGGSAN